MIDHVTYWMIHGFLILSCVFLGANAKSRCLRKLFFHSIFSSQAKTLSLDPKNWVFYIANLGDILGGYWATTKELVTKTMTYLLKTKFTTYEKNWDCRAPLSSYQTWCLKPKPSSDHVISALDILAKEAASWVIRCWIRWSLGLETGLTYWEMKEGWVQP